MVTPDRAGGVARLPVPAPAAPPQALVPSPTRFLLGNGLPLIVVPWGELPQLVLRLVLPAGTLFEPAGRPGTAGLVGRLLTEGTAALSGEELNRHLDLLGAAVEIHVGHDFADIELLMLSETQAEALALLAELVVNPSFPMQEMERARREVLDSLAARQDESANVADDRAAAAVFGVSHPYGRPSAGTAAGIETVTRDELRAFHAATYRPTGSFVVASGACDAERLAELLTEALGGWTGVSEEAEVPSAPARVELAGQQLDLAWPEAQQAEIRVAGLGLERTSPDWVAAAVANYILGGSTITGRLGANLREDKGWTYGARSSFSAGLQPGGWMVETAVDVEVRDAAVDEIVGELRRMVEEPVADHELRRAQEALVLSLPRAFESPGRVVSRFVTIEGFGLDSNYWQDFPSMVRKVTTAEVQRISDLCFTPERLVKVVVG